MEKNEQNIEKSIRWITEKFCAWLRISWNKEIKDYITGVIVLWGIFIVFSIIQKVFWLLLSSDSFIIHFISRTVLAARTMFSIWLPLWVLIMIAIKKRRLRESFFRKESYWDRDKEDVIVPQYYPPKNLEPILLFRFWYNWSNPRVISATIYHLFAKGNLKIENIDKKYLRWLIKTNHYMLTNVTATIKKNKRAETSSLFDETQVEKIYESVEEDRKLTSLEKHILDILIPQKNIIMKKNTKLVGSTIRHVYSDIKKWFPTSLYIKTSPFFWWKSTLTELWEELINHLYWYKEYLKKVEILVVQQELKSDPNYINKILPRLILFDIRDDLTKIQENIIKNATISQIDWYYDWEQVLFE